jgi:carboxyl-terminal processing protease
MEVTVVAAFAASAGAGEPFSKPGTLIAPHGQDNDKLVMVRHQAIGFFRRALRNTCHALVLAIMVFGIAPLWAADSMDAANASTYQSDIASAASLIFHLSRFSYPANFTQKPDYERQVLSNYVDQLDPEHIFFSAEDVTGILKHANDVLAAMQGRDTSVAEDAATQHSNRAKQRIGYALTLINKGFKFDGQDSIVVNASSVPDFLPEDALSARWEKIIKSDWLNLKLQGLPDAQIRHRLTSRYTHFLQALVKADQTFALVGYVRACVVAGDPAGGYWNTLHSEKATNPAASQNTLVLDGDADGPLIGEDSGEASTRLRMGDRLVGISVGGGDITYLDGATAAAATSLLTSLPEDAEVKLYIRRVGTLPGAPIVEVPFGLATAPDLIKLSMQFYTPSGATQRERVAVITVPVMYGFTRRKGDGATSKDRVDVDLREALAQARAQGAVAAVLDLRDDTGGYMDTIARVAQIFLGNRAPWRMQTKDSITPPTLDGEAVAAWDGPLTVLVNGGTAEGGEMVAAALQDYGRALIVGDKTAGNGSIGTRIDLNRFATQGRATPSDYGLLNMTIGGVFRADGESIAGRGVTPDVVVPQPMANNRLRKEESFPPIAPVAVDAFTAFQAADAEVVRNHRHSDDAARHRDADPSTQAGDVLALNYAQRKSAQHLDEAKADLEEEDPVIKEVVQIAYEQSRVRTTPPATTAAP